MRRIETTTENVRPAKGEAIPGRRSPTVATRAVPEEAPLMGSETASMSAGERARSLGVEPNQGLGGDEAARRLAKEGANQVPEKPSHPVLVFARKFWGLSAWMIELIAALSLVLHKMADFWIAIALLLVNALLSFFQEERAFAAVAALRHQLEVTARALRDGSWKVLAARDLVPGDIVRVRGGDFVPADVQLLDGELRVDQSALTGESRELSKARDELVYSGTVVRRGEATAIVVATGTRTYFGRTTHLVETAHPKLHVEEVISRVVRWLFLIVGVLVLASVALSLVRGIRLVEILPLSLVLLMSAVPVALPVMFTVTMAIGSLALAKKGVLVTRLSAAEDAATLDVLCADKTGTLTANRLTLMRALPQPGFSDEDVIRDGALASNDADRDPIDVAFLEAARRRNLLGSARVVEFKPFSPEARRTEAEVEIDGRRVHVYKGALRTLAELCGLDATATSALEATATAAAPGGERVLAVARKADSARPALVGLVMLSDPPRPDSRELIAKLRSLGVAVKMLTGDALPVAREIARGLGLGDVVRAPELRGGERARAAELARAHDGFAEVFPEDKYLVVESLQAAGHVVGMTGDGVNDAPALKQAEVGIAVSGATDVAKGAASVVLTREGLGSIVDLVENGRSIYQRVLTWIVNKVSRTILKSGFVVVAFLVTGRFVISALAMVLLVFMTDFVKIALSTDRVRGSARPETWNIGPLVRVGVVLGVLMLVESLGLLAIGWKWLGVAEGPGRLETFSFQVLLFFALFSILSIRERRRFWSSAPSAVLALALGADAFVGTLIGRFGMAELHPISLRQTGLIVASALVCSLVLNDFVKTMLIRRIQRDHHSTENQG